MNFKEKLMSMEINLDQFYRSGKIIFTIIACASLYTLIYTWTILDLGSKVSGIFGIAFNIVLVLFFNYLHHNLPPIIPKIDESSPNPKELEELMENLK